MFTSVRINPKPFDEFECIGPVRSAPLRRMLGGPESDA
jgi:hypothetical protein